MTHVWNVIIRNESVNFISNLLLFFWEVCDQKEGPGEGCPGGLTSCCKEIANTVLDVKGSKVLEDTTPFFLFSFFSCQEKGISKVSYVFWVKGLKMLFVVLAMEVVLIFHCCIKF